MKEKRGIISEYLPWLLIGMGILALIMVTIFLLKEKGLNLIDQLRDLLKGG